jgi:glutamate racemase
MAFLPELPIGVFDSGLGGLTVLRSLRARLPYENFVYLGDVARLPYGTKSQAVIREYASQCIRFLLQRQVKAIVIACNTASALARESLQPEVGVPLFGVVESGVAAGVAVAKSQRRLLVLATESTVRSEAYLKRFAQVDPSLGVEQLACPLLVPLAEEGWFDHEVTQKVIQQYLLPIDLTAFDGMVLGCTHFPLLEPSFRHVLPASLALVHGAPVLAEELAQFLAGSRLLNPQTEKGQLHLLTTDRISHRLPLLGDWLTHTTACDVVHLSP